jgi:hypothetical protein
MLVYLVDGKQLYYDFLYGQLKQLEYPTATELQNRAGTELCITENRKTTRVIEQQKLKPKKDPI